LITAVDSSVLIDVFRADEEFGPRSGDAIRACRAQGGLIACEVVFAEVAAGFPDSALAAHSLDRLGVRLVPFDAEMALVAGQAWRAYRRRVRKRDRVIADFLVGAHATHAADRLLTRDRGFYSSYFHDLDILDPSRARYSPAP
jgi:predicted nucleic acid-binding protein